ncbi:patatin-like phospholipase family protein [Polaromonas sp.]|uniref:patatin-like phospholipase family protein n=1 Tax=Polaromonas sp. TaxID=1869339 RepID=UPI00178FB5C2|nr:patatin-like phospholipase family protein [Polaromonas sp.]NMM04824.1 patatin-like phospholipase family protein [Polaromonas sp.]
MKALRIYAGPQARQHIAQNGLQPQDIAVVPGAAGGPKGLILGPLDRFIFGDWLAQSTHTVHLVGASIGAWRMATACLTDPVAAFQRLESDYIHQHFEVVPGQKRPSAQLVSEQFGESLKSFYGGRVQEVLQHPRYRLHIITSRGRHLLGREHKLRTPLGYLGAFLTNSVHRKAMGAWLERVVFSSQGAPLPFATSDYRTRQVTLTDANFQPALQASCSIPFALKAVHNIPGAPPGAYWDGGITDYHLHLNYAPDLIAACAGVAGSTGTFDTEKAGKADKSGRAGLVLYPHFQKAVVPGWLDKGLKWRHGATHFLDRMVLLAPDPQWVKTLPNGKLPDRSDFPRYGTDLQGRAKAWRAAASAGEQLAEEWRAWLARPELGSLGSL